jgi:FHS family Na+ dependent glucose MFS transporter 1
MLLFRDQGINFSILSPTLTHLAHAYGTDLVGISAVYTSRSAGYLIGALFGCLLFRFMNRELTLSLMYFLIAGALLSVTMITNLTAAVIVMGIQGFCTGVCDSATNVMICQTWKQKASPYIQALYFFFGCGCTIAPLIVAPFLSTSHFRFAYYITCAVLVVAGAVLLPLAFVEHHEPEHDEDEDETRDLVTEGYSLKQALEWCRQRGNQSTVIIVILVAVMIMAYSGMEIIYWEFITTYLLKIPHLHMLPQEATYMTAAVNYAFTLIRGLAIFVVWKIKPTIVIMFNLMLIMIACGLLLFSDTMTTVWIGNIMIGAAFSTVYPQIYAYAVTQITITNFIGSLLVFSSGATSVFYPKLVAREIEKHHNFLIWLVLISVALTFAAFLTLISFVRFFKRRPSPYLYGNDYELPSCSTRM